VAQLVLIPPSTNPKFAELFDKSSGTETDKLAQLGWVMIMHEHGSKKHQAGSRRNPQSQVQPPVEIAPSTCDVKQAASTKKCSTCGAVLERIDGCPQCGKGENKPAGGAPNIEKRPFKLYANISSPIENDLYKMLSQAFSEKDPRERPWCGLGVEVGLLAVSPTHLTVADIKEINGVQQAVVHVPQNWREPWYVEASGGARHQVPDNPCDQAERAISGLKNNLDPSRSNDDQPTCPCIKYLIIFPDGYRFEGPKEFSIIEREQVLTLQLRNMRELPAAILAPTQQQRLDSRSYRSWIEGTILKKSDDSIVGTWLDPAFDKVESEPPKRERWRLCHLSRKKVSSEKQEVSSTESLRMTPIQQTFNWGQFKLIGMVIAGMMIGIIGWQLFDADKSLTSGSHSNPSMSPSRPENSVSSAEAAPVAISLNRVSSWEIDNDDTVAAIEIGKSSEPRETELDKHDQGIQSARKLSEQTHAPEDSELKRRQIELQIDKAIRLRAIAGVSVYFVGDTAHLKGRVGTETQKSAAEKAARGVPGVKDVRSSIEIEFLLSGDG
jgi:BON domain